VYLTQVAQGDLPNSPFNETHWREPRFIDLIQQARAELDDARRRDILHEAQTMQYEQGGYIIQYFSNIIDAHSKSLGGFVEAKCGFPFGNYWFKNIGFVQES
jgi:peptide/nickel transport system substrate-binding protein